MSGTALPKLWRSVRKRVCSGTDPEPLRSKPKTEIGRSSMNHRLDKTRLVVEFGDRDVLVEALRPVLASRSYILEPAALRGGEPARAADDGLGRARSVTAALTGSAR